MLSAAVVIIALKFKLGQQQQQELQQIHSHPIVALTAYQLHIFCMKCLNLFSGESQDSQYKMSVVHCENIKEDTQEMPQLRSKALARCQMKERCGTNNDKTNATYESTDAQRRTATEELLVRKLLGVDQLGDNCFQIWHLGR